MITNKDLQDLIEYIFGKIESSLSISFFVRTYGDYVDNIKDTKKRFKNQMVVYSLFDEGEIEPLPDIDAESIDTMVNIYCPISKRDDLNSVISEFYKYTTGQYQTINTKKMLLTHDKEKFQYNENMETWCANELGINLQHDKDGNLDNTDTWVVCSIPLYINTCKNLGSTGGLDFGNSIKTKLSIKVNNAVYSSYILAPDNATGSEGSQSTQQGTTKHQTETTNSATTYGTSLTAYYQNNDFWNTFIDLKEKGLLLEQIVVKLEREYTMINKTYTHYYTITQVAEDLTLGTYITYTLAFVKALDIEKVEQWGNN